MAEEKQKKQSHKEERKEYTYNKLKGLGQEIIEEIEKIKFLLLKFHPEVLETLFTITPKDTTY